jgi:DNA (cytosine-5)-methyltransferase 1
VLGVHHKVGVRPLTVTQGKARHVPVSSVLEPEGAVSWSPVYRKGRAAATIIRIENGRRRYGDRFLVPFYGSGSGKTDRSLDRPIGTITTRDRWALVSGDRMRMLTARECLRCQGFPDPYRVPSVHRLAVFLTGNALPPSLARCVCEHIKVYAA